MNIAEIAKRANVSTATVSRTLNQSGPVKAATARKVWRAVTELNYYPNSHARALVSGRSRLIGLIVSDITNPFFPELVRAFQDLAAQKQYDVLLTSTDYLTSRMTECLRRMLERKVDGVAMMTSEMDLGLIKELSKRNVVDLDPERRAAMVSNLLVVLCGERGTQPVVNAGSLYTG